jgi:hypothetical protein
VAAAAAVASAASSGSIPTTPIHSPNPTSSAFMNSVPTPELLDSYSEYSSVCELIKYLFEVAFPSTSSILSPPPSYGPNFLSLLNISSCSSSSPSSPYISTPSSHLSLRIQSSSQSSRMGRGSPISKTPHTLSPANINVASQISPVALPRSSSMTDSSLHISLPSTTHPLSISNLVPKSPSAQSGNFSQFPFTLIKTCNLILVEGMSCEE